MKPKKQNGKYANKNQRYFYDEADCANCLYYKGIKRGCTLTACSCEDIKIGTNKKGRAKEKRGHNAWDM